MVIHARDMRALVRQNVLQEVRRHLPSQTCEAAHIGLMFVGSDGHVEYIVLKNGKLGYFSAPDRASLVYWPDDAGKGLICG